LVDTVIPLIDTRNKLVTDNLGFARMVAGRMLATIPKQAVDQNDVYAQAYLGLIYAADKFDQDFEVEFVNFAYKRIKGCIQDYLRSIDHLPKADREVLRNYEKDLVLLRQELGRSLTSTDIEDRFGISPETQGRIAHGMIATVSVGMSAPWSENIPGKASDSPGWQYEYGENVEWFKTQILGLPPRERLIFALYFGFNVQMKEIGRIMGVTEARISQLVKWSIELMNEHWEDRKLENWEDQNLEDGMRKGGNA